MLPFAPSLEGRNQAKQLKSLVAGGGFEPPTFGL